MKIVLKTSYLLLVTLLIVSCNDTKTTRKVRYMADTDMYNSVPYDAYTINPNFKNGQTSQAPVAGTLSRTASFYDIPNTEPGYLFAKDSLKSPLETNEKNLEKGKYLFGIYCSVCHGDAGDGQGILMKNEKFLGVPNYKDREITQGSIYHVIMYGRNLMGSHSSQLTELERWQIAQYVEKLRADLLVK